jgi:hypothetical protein
VKLGRRQRCPIWRTPAGIFNGRVIWTTNARAPTLRRVILESRSPYGRITDPLADLDSRDKRRSVTVAESKHPVDRGTDSPTRSRRLESPSAQAWPNHCGIVGCLRRRELWVAT